MKAEPRCHHQHRSIKLSNQAHILSHRERDSQGQAEAYMAGSAHTVSDQISSQRGPRATDTDYAAAEGAGQFFSLGPCDSWPSVLIKNEHDVLSFSQWPAFWDISFYLPM